MDICIDFDGTCVKHEFPEIGEDIGAVPVLKELTDKGHRLILFTMRSGEYLEAAVDWFKQNKIPLFGINKNPEQESWTQSPKAYGQIYIDDAALGCPLIYEGGRPYVNWEVVSACLSLRGLFNENISSI